MVMTALMMGLILAATSLFKIPVPMTQGYVHLGDAMIFLSVLLLGKKYGAAAAGLGSALGDILGGYAYFAPWTFLIKFLMAFVCGLVIERAYSRKEKKYRLAAERNPEEALPKIRITGAEVLGIVLGGLVMTAGYFLVEVPMYGHWGTALAEVPWNIAQFAVGGVVATAIAAPLSKTSARQYFAYPL